MSVYENGSQSLFHCTQFEVLSHYKLTLSFCQRNLVCTNRTWPNEIEKLHRICINALQNLCKVTLVSCSSQPALTEILSKWQRNLVWANTSLSNEIEKLHRICISALQNLCKVTLVSCSSQPACNKILIKWQRNFVWAIISWA